jgi:hypothetical protein
VHQWRQSDCYAYAKRYYEDNSSFFHPAVYNLVGKNGRTVSEFPIFYYVGAQICKLIGFHNYVFRGLTFLSYFFGLIYLYKAGRFFIKSPLLAMFPVLVLATAPYYYYYGLNYLPNVPAISFSFIGLYFYLYYEKTNKTKHLIWATFWTALGVLLKPTDGGVIFVAYGLCIGLLWIGSNENRKKIIPIAISCFTVLFFMFLWYKYVAYYNDLNGNHNNLQSIYPIWERTETEIAYDYRERIFGWWQPVYQQLSILYLLKILLYVFAITWAWQNAFLRLFTSLLIGHTWI